MKYRTDFVTNSSSSSFISVNCWALPSIKGKSDVFPGVKIGIASTETDDDSDESVKVKSPLPLLVKQYSVAMNKPMNENNIVNSKANRQSFLDFVNSVYGTTLQDRDFLKISIDYSKGFGESETIGMEEAFNRLLENAHPNIQKALLNVPTDYNFLSKYTARRVKIENNQFQAERMYFSPSGQVNETVNWTDSSLEVYEYLYDMAGKPALPISDMMGKLKEFNLSANEIMKLVEQDMQILYVGSYFIHDVIVCRKPGETKFQILAPIELSMTRRLAQYSIFDRYVGQSTVNYKMITNGDLDESYINLTQKELQDKYAVSTSHFDHSTTEYFNNGKIPEIYKKQVKKIINIGGKTISFSSSPKAALNNLEKVLATLPERNFFSCDSLLANPDTLLYELPIVPPDIVKVKLLEFLQVVILYLKDENLLDIIHQTEKKKNGFLYKGRVLPLCWCDVASGDSFHALRAVNKDDTTVVVEIKKVNCTPREIQKYKDLPDNFKLIQKLKRQ